MADLTTFTQGSVLHLFCLVVCLILTTVAATLARRDLREGRANSVIRDGIAAGCVLSWCLSNGYGILPGKFSWDQSLPLHFCNLANLIGAVAVRYRFRTAQSLMYFWTFGLCLWAFLTPSLYVGPLDPWFWLFWLYHVFILISVIWILVADRFRPGWRDCGRSLILTLIYMAILTVLDYFTGWNYGFVGPSVPDQTTILDFLGPYPIRLLWMALVGTGIFALLLVPWIRWRPERKTGIPSRSSL